MSGRESNRQDHLRLIAQRLKEQGNPNWEEAQRLADLHSFGRPVVHKPSVASSVTKSPTRSVERQVYTARTTQTSFYAVEESPDENRLRLRFAAKVSAEVKRVLRAADFRWSPSENAWQRPLDKGQLGTVLDLYGSVRLAIEEAMGGELSMDAPDREVEPSESAQERNR